MLAMFFNSLDADAKFRGDLLIGLAFGNELEHFHLARSQTGGFFVKLPRAAGWLRTETIEAKGNRGTEKCFPLVYFPDGPAYLVGRGLLEQKSHRPGFGRVF